MFSDWFYERHEKSYDEWAGIRTLDITSVRDYFNYMMFEARLMSVIADEHAMANLSTALYNYIIGGRKSRSSASVCV
jgi:hypothetical protein